MTELRTEPVARRTRSSGRYLAANLDSSPNNTLDAAVNTPLPEVQTSSRTSGLGEYNFFFKALQYNTLLALDVSARWCQSGLVTC